MASAARTALTASSSWATGIPNTAMTASPMNFCTVPPWASSTARMRPYQRAMSCDSDSGSSRSPSSVEPVTSPKTTVTSLRVWRGPSPVGAASCVPQFEQKRAASGLTCPQAGQVTPAGCMRPV
jgi:hypothetical protein